MAVITTFLEPGTSATQDLSLFKSTVGTVASATDQLYLSSRSLKGSSGAGNAVFEATTGDGLFLDSGSQLDFWFYFDAAPTVVSSIFQIRTNAGAAVTTVRLNTTRTLVNAPAGVSVVNGSTVMATNTWYRISYSFYITDTTHFGFKLYLNGNLEATVNTGTITNTGANRIAFGVVAANLGANKNFWYSHIYIATGGASSSSQPDTGNILVTYKRPFSNGTTNGFTGSGTPSGYGSGNARYVNEQPLSTTNFVSVVGAGSAITEEYNIEAKSAGEINLGSNQIVDYTGWVYAKSLLSETGQIVVNGVATNIALTSTTTAFQVGAGSTVYPAGTGTDIGLITDTTVTTVTLYECGILIAYIPAPFNRNLNINQAIQRSAVR